MVMMVARHKKARQDSQKKAATLMDAQQMRWDPIMVRWCLYLRHLSSSAYETLHDTGTIFHHREYFEIILITQRPQLGLWRRWQATANCCKAAIMP